MRSTLRRCPFGRGSALLVAVALGGLGACGSSPDGVQETLGVVQAAPAPDAVAPNIPGRPAPSTIVFKAFQDEVGRRAASETRALITSAAGYAEYFGHAAPPEVDFSTEWVIFYAAGTQRSGGYRADVRSIAANGDTLNVVTLLFQPGAGCAVTDALTTPHVLVKFPAQRTRSVIFQHSDTLTKCGLPPTPTPPGCAVILCPAGTICVEDKSNPPQARCEAINPPPAGCASTAQCPAGLVCSTELGMCGRNPNCRDGAACDAACWGTCVMKTDPGPAPSRCTSTQQCGKGQRCSTERGECLGCGSMSSLVACPAVCFGVCEPTTPTPGPTCVSTALMGGCRSEEELKAEAAGLCKQRGWVLTEFGVGNACFAGGFVEAKFTCCGGPQPPPPPPPPTMCTSGLLMGGCRSADEIKLEAAELCKRQNLMLTDFGVGAACFAGGFVEAKYACCGGPTPPPPPPPPPPATCKVDSDCTLTSNYCSDMPCSCQANPRAVSNGSGAALPCRAVACLVDPCGGKTAACVAGQCTIAMQPVPTPPPQACTWDYMGGATSCKPYDVWKQYAADACKQKGQALTNLSTGGACAGGSFIEIKYECCATR